MFYGELSVQQSLPLPSAFSSPPLPSLCGPWGEMQPKLRFFSLFSSFRDKEKLFRANPSAIIFAFVESHSPLVHRGMRGIGKGFWVSLPFLRGHRTGDVSDEAPLCDTCSSSPLSPPLDTQNRARPARTEISPQNYRVRQKNVALPKRTAPKEYKLLGTRYERKGFGGRDGGEGGC